MPPRAKMLGPTLPLSSALTSARPSARCTAGRPGLQVSWSLTLTLDWPLKGCSQGAWRHNVDDWGPPNPSAGLTLPPHAIRAARGSAGHSVREIGKDPLSPR